MSKRWEIFKEAWKSFWLLLSFVPPLLRLAMDIFNHLNRPSGEDMSPELWRMAIDYAGLLLIAFMAITIYRILLIASTARVELETFANPQVSICKTGASGDVLYVQLASTGAHIDACTAEVRIVSTPTSIAKRFSREFYKLATQEQIRYQNPAPLGVNQGGATGGPFPISSGAPVRLDIVHKDANSDLVQIQYENVTDRQQKMVASPLEFQLRISATIGRAITRLCRVCWVDGQLKWIDLGEGSDTK